MVAKFIKINNIYFFSNRKKEITLCIDNVKYDILIPKVPTKLISMKINMIKEQLN